MPLIHCSLGIIVYNEAGNIAKLLRSLQNQKLEKVVIDKIIVVSSACTDGTDDIVRQFAAEDEKIELLAEPERRGKSAAINSFISKADSEILIIESGDTIPALDTVEKMAGIFADKRIGMSGGRPVPENCACNAIGKAVQLLWDLHHRMALKSPKLGEMVAFRNIIRAIPEKSAVDEASIEAMIMEQGLELRYLPDALVYNKGPENWREFISQRRRIASGHIWLSEQQEYKVASQNGGLLLQLAIDQVMRKPYDLPYIIMIAAVEVYSRFLGWWDLKVLKKNPFKWEIAKTTKKMQRFE
ncbi:MAG: glycosyltransferase [Candidatus Cloacimonetes bacterium]|nr:glycosyltransferase [Candidatus Cloacimonadota bacterium]